MTILSHEECQGNSATPYANECRMWGFCKRYHSHPAHRRAIKNRKANKISLSRLRRKLERRLEKQILKNLEEMEDENDSDEEL